MVFTQSEATAAERRWFFRLASTADGTALTGATASVRWGKGATGAAGAGTVTEVSAANDPGLYYYEATAGELDTLGKVLLTPSAAGAYTFTYPGVVVAYDATAAPDDAEDVAGAVADELGDGAAFTEAGAANIATVAGFVDTEIAALQAAIAALNNLSEADVQAALTAQGLTAEMVEVMRVASLLSGDDWTRAGDVITLADGTTLTLTTNALGVTTAMAVAAAP